jgi:hypothetical protein
MSAPIPMYRIKIFSQAKNPNDPYGFGGAGVASSTCIGMKRHSFFALS